MIGKLLFLVILVVWVVRENKAVNQRAQQHPDSPWDAASMQVLVWGSGLAVVLALACSFLPVGILFESQITALLLGGLVLAGAGWVRVRAIRDLQERFTPNVVILADHQLRSDGIYHYVRHPGYAGALFIYLGMGLLLNNAISLLILVLVLVPVYLYRIRVEEQALLQTFGDQYAEYSRRTRRLIPGVY